MIDYGLMKKKENEIKQHRDKTLFDFMNQHNITREKHHYYDSCPSCHYYVTILGVKFYIGLIIEHVGNDNLFAAINNEETNNISMFNNETLAIQHLHQKFAKTIERKING